MEETALIIYGFGLGVFLIIMMSLGVWLLVVVYKDMSSQKVLLNALQKTIYDSVKIKIYRKYDRLEDLITSMTKNYVVTNDGIEFFIESTGNSYYLETGTKNNHIPMLRVLK